MMEFFLSKMWAGLCGVMLLGVCVTSIGDLGHASTDLNDKDMLEALGQEIDGACMVDGESVHTISIDGRFRTDSDIVQVRQGSIWLMGQGKSYARALISEPVIFDIDGEPIGLDGVITLDQNDRLIVEKHANGSSTMRPQSANVATTF